MCRSYAFLKMFTEVDSRIMDGRLFQTFAPRTGKEFCRRSSLAGFLVAYVKFGDASLADQCLQV